MAEKRTGAAEHPKVAAVRKAADTLADAIREAKDAGFAVDWPSRADTLRSIAVSETDRVGADTSSDLTGTAVETKTVET